MTGGIRYWIAVVVLSGATAMAAAQPAKGPPTLDELDQLAVDVLRDVHNRGAELYNRGDAAGCYRMYESALITVRPFLAHRPTLQKTIDSGLAEAARSPDGVKVQAYRLHEVIEDIRTDLKGKDKKAEVKPAKPLPQAPPPKTATPPAKSDSPPAKSDSPPAKSDSPPAGPGGPAQGKVTLDGKPLAAGEVMLVSLSLPKPRIFTAKVTQGTYHIADPLPAGKYAVIVTGQGVPEKFHTTLTSSLVAEVASGPNELNLDLKSK